MDDSPSPVGIELDNDTGDEQVSEVFPEDNEKSNEMLQIEANDNLSGDELKHDDDLDDIQGTEELKEEVEFEEDLGPNSEDEIEAIREGDGGDGAPDRGTAITFDEPNVEQDGQKLEIAAELQWNDGYDNGYDDESNENDAGHHEDDGNEDVVPDYDDHISVSSLPEYDDDLTNADGEDKDTETAEAVIQLPEPNEMGETLGDNNDEFIREDANDDIQHVEEQRNGELEFQNDTGPDPLPKLQNDNLGLVDSDQLRDDGSQNDVEDPIIVEEKAGESDEPYTAPQAVEIVEDDHKTPIIIDVADTEFLLVPFKTEHSDVDYSHLVSLFDSDEVLDLSIEDFFGLMRQNEDLNEIYNFSVDEELVLKFPQFDGLHLTEDNVYSREVSFNDFVSTFEQLAENTQTQKPPSMSCVLTVQTRFISKFNGLAELIREKKGFESIPAQSVWREKRPAKESSPTSQKRQKVFESV